MPDNYKKYYQINPAAFIPFNDSPTYMRGEVGTGERDALLIKGSSRYQLQGWHNMGGRTCSLDKQSFEFSVNAVPRYAAGAYTVGIISTNSTPKINISHFLRSSVQLNQECHGTNFYSGYGLNNHNERTQVGPSAPFDPIGRIHNLTVSYDNEIETLSCTANRQFVHQIHAKLDKFFLEISIEAVGIESTFEVLFEDLFYYPRDKRKISNVLKLNGWDPQFPPIFVSYSHEDREHVQSMVGDMRGAGVRVLGDWDLRIGDSLIQRLSQFISRSGYLLVMLSSASVRSTWVENELRIALDAEMERNSRKRVLPIVIDDCEIPAYLRGRLYHDFRKYNLDSLNRLLKEIRSFGVW